MLHQVIERSGLSRRYPRSLHESLIKTGEKPVLGLTNEKDEPFVCFQSPALPSIALSII
jgi:hypothetical protein